MEKPCVKQECRGHVKIKENAQPKTENPRYQSWKVKQ